MARKRSPALPVPATDAEAAELLAAYVRSDRIILNVRLHAEQAIDQIKTDRDALIAEQTAKQTTRFAALKAWWEAGGNKLAGTGRSAELAGARLGIRKSPPKVKIAKGTNVALLIGWLRVARMAWAKALVRAKYELDKPSVIKIAQADEKARAALLAKGVTVEQLDEFFIDTGLEAEPVAAEPAEEAAA